MINANHVLLFSRSLLIVLEILHSCWSVGAIFPRKFERINRVAWHVLLHNDPYLFASNPVKNAWRFLRQSWADLPPLSWWLYMAWTNSNHHADSTVLWLKLRNTRCYKLHFTQNKSSSWGRQPVDWFVIVWFVYQSKRHDDVIKWKHFPRYWPFVRGIHRPPVNSPHKGQWCGALMFSLIFV